MSATSPESSCPEDENATACLLRAVLLNLQESSSTYDWDPVNFAFTLLIGILALMFTLLSIFQSILAAGPGRRKTSRNAIGPWSSKTSRVWDFHELRRLSFAETPVIALEPLCRQLRFRESRTKIEWSSYNNPSAATWLSFLQRIGLVEFDLMRLAEPKITLADFLPDDLNAVPAYAETRCIIALAAAAGARAVYNDGSHYPLMVADDFQLDFRQHPGLGVVAAFARYGTTRPRFWPEPDDLISALENSRAHVIYSRRKYGPLSTWYDAPFYRRLDEAHNLHHSCEPGQQGNEDSPRSAQSEATTHESPFSKNQNHSITQDLCKLWHDGNIPSTESCLPLWLLEGDRPGTVPSIFPSNSIQLAEHLHLLALQSSFWTMGNLTFLSTVEVKSLTLRKLAWCGLSEQERTAYEERKDLDFEDPHNMSDNFESYLSDDVYILSPALIKLSSRLLQDSARFSSWMSNLSDTQGSWLRRHMSDQLDEIEQWLSLRPQKTVTCLKCRVALVATSLGAIDRSLSGGQLEWGRRDEDLEWDCVWDPAWLAAVKTPSLIGKHHSLLETLCSQGIHEEVLLRAAMMDLLKSCHETAREAMSDDEWNNQLGSFEHAPSPTQESLLRHQSIDAGGEFDRNKIHRQLARMRQNHERNSSRRRMFRHEEETEEGCIKNMLIWRSILMAMLFMTAVDNTRILTSGIGTQIIPIL